MYSWSGMPLFPVDFMDKKPIGNSREYVSAIGVGTWGIRNYINAEKALKHALSLGLNLIDTAEIYGSGKAEELVGKVVKEFGVDAFITTKLPPERFTSKDEVINAAKASLRRLGLKSVDLILIHWPNPRLPVSKQIKLLEGLVDEGLCRYIGVSNFKVNELLEALEATSKYDIVVNQVKYSVYDKSVEKGLLPLCIREGVTIQAYTPLEGGLVANDKALTDIGSRYGKTAVQVALNYLISRPNVVAIPKSERVERINEFKGAMGWRLNDKDIDIIEMLSR
ncbi:MAG: aldo/keto reductase [Sulfolobales archaeon]